MARTLTAIFLVAVMQLSSHAAPPLDLQRTAPETFQLSWPSLDRNWVLQGSPSLEGPSWETVLVAPSLVGANLRLQVALPAESSSYFFRLRQQATSGAFGGLNFLHDSQNTFNGWGWGSAGTDLRDTTAALDAFSAFAVSDAAQVGGHGALGATVARNNDELSRQIISHSASGADVSSLVTTLLAAGNAEVLDQTSLEYPGSGWGVAAGFGNSTIDTALALRALASVGKIGGLAVVKESLAGSATSPAHPFTIPAGATDLRLISRERSVPVRYTLTYPGGGGGYSIDFSAGSTPIDVDFDIEAGAFTLETQNLSASAGTHSAEVAFITDDGFDFGRITTALMWLGGAQNGDGGWGPLKGDPSHLMISAEVMRGLSACGNTFAPASKLANAAAWIVGKQNADGGFSSHPPTSNTHETSLAMIALHAAQPATSLVSASNYLRSKQLYNGSWDNDPLETALAIQALHLPPVVAIIPGQSVNSPAAFATINLDNFVADSDHADNQITWGVTGNTLLGVSIVNRVATITYTPGSTSTEQLTFTATDPDGFTGSATATFSVALPAVDFTIARGGSVTGSRTFTADPAVLNQAVAFDATPNGVPSGGLSYSTTGLGRISANTMEANFQINASPTATTGIRTFSVTYNLYDANDVSLGPLTGNVMNFTINVTP